ncbi:MAG: helix-turn-helix domain-containing protein [Deltaproteobacteria bacterium]|nr:helix-turn-helix domain-containing protein [Deltaproteobacteria bacterium]
MTVEEVARFLRVTTKTVYALIRRGQLPSFRVGRAMRCRRSDLHRFVEKGCEASLDSARAAERSRMG